MRIHEKNQAMQAPVCELHEQRTLASLGTHHQGSSPALTPTLGSLRRKTKARGRKSHTDWPKNTKCAKATVNFHDQSIERERVQIGMAHGLIRNYREKLCRTTAPTSSPWPGQLRRWSDRCPPYEFESVKRVENVESCGTCLETQSLTSRDLYKSMLMWTYRALRSCPLRDNDKCIAEAQESTCQPRAKRYWHKQENRQMCRKCLVFLWRKDQGTKRFSWICLLTDWVYEVLYCDGSK